VREDEPVIRATWGSVIRHQQNVQRAGASGADPNPWRSRNGRPFGYGEWLDAWMEAVFREVGHRRAGPHLRVPVHGSVAVPCKRSASSASAWAS
jgi:hypothetical protein